MRHDVVRRPRPFSFVHLGLPDHVGHSYGRMSESYLHAVRRVDRALGLLDVGPILGSTVDPGRRLTLR